MTLSYQLIAAEHVHIERLTRSRFSECLKICKAKSKASDVDSLEMPSRSASLSTGTSAAVNTLQRLVADASTSPIIKLNSRQRAFKHASCADALSTPNSTPEIANTHSQR